MVLHVLQYMQYMCGAWRAWRLPGWANEQCRVHMWQDALESRLQARTLCQRLIRVDIAGPEGFRQCSSGAACTAPRY
jgi:hypothetical protein